MDCGSGVALGEGATDGVFAGEGDCVDGVFGPVGAGDIICARRSPPQHDSTTNAENKRTPVFDVFRMVSFENVEYTDVHVNRKPENQKVLEIKSHRLKAFIAVRSPIGCLSSFRSCLPLRRARLRSRALG